MEHETLNTDELFPATPEQMVKLEALKARGIFRCKLADIMIGGTMVRIDREDKDNTILRLGVLTSMAEGNVDAGWILYYDEAGVVKVTQNKDALYVDPMLDRYNEILDDLVAIADNGSLS